MQPDSLIPDSSNPQAWNRYSYVGNRPVNANDPTGHETKITSFDPEMIFLGVIIALGVAALYDQGRRHVVNGAGCTDTLTKCFQSKENKQFSNNQEIDKTEYRDLTNAVYDDLNSKWFRTAWDPSRAGYDTPFFNGTQSDSTVCVSGKCSKQSSVNYFAQGMYSAHTGQSELMGEYQIQAWNLIAHRHTAESDEYYWFEQGYNEYNNIKKDRETKSPSSKSPNFASARKKLLDL